MTTGDQGPGRDPQTALEHLQQAAIEMIAAARVMLDGLDAVVAEPPGPGTILERFGPLAETIWQLMGTASNRTPPDRPDGGTPVQHIPVQ